MAYGPLILGHAHPDIRAAIERQLEKGWLYGTPSPLEPEMARRITRGSPGHGHGAGSFQAVRRRPWQQSAWPGDLPGKADIVKIEGGFHGAHDGVLVKAGSGATTHGVPDSAGVLPDLVSHTRQVPYNDPEALEEVLSTER